MPLLVSQVDHSIAVEARGHRQEDDGWRLIPCGISLGHEYCCNRENDREGVNGKTTAYLERTLCGKLTWRVTQLWYQRRNPAEQKAKERLEKLLAAIKQKLEAAGFKEIKPGVYDTRDLNIIRG